MRLRRVELPPDVTGPVYQRMESERRRVANELRSLGGAESERIRADADRQRQVILADAYRQAQKIKGEGDAKASAIYAQAYGQNPEFYAFYRSLEAYRSTFKNKSDLMVLDPSAEFFQYFKQSGSGPRCARPAKRRPRSEPRERRKAHVRSACGTCLTHGLRYGSAARVAADRRRRAAHSGRSRCVWRDDVFAA